MDPKNENFNMFDLIAYRIKFVEHPHAGERKPWQSFQPAGCEDAR